MRENVRDRDRLEHIVEAIDRILAFADGKTKEELEADDLKYYGIVKNIEIIGEATYMLTRAFCNQHPETPWEFIAKMRHVLVHDYYQIEPREVWKVIRDDLHPLRKQVAGYLANTDWNEWEKNEVAITETAAHKTLIQTARRMKKDGMTTQQISRYTGLTIEEIEGL
ncbi:MAG: DUF86 domain-containing protein [Prevotella sp.]|jgi:uncharacterized protein with HEPN domain|nr:DUF86 domain-containing protein [Prevotella sp.]